MKIFYQLLRLIFHNPFVRSSFTQEEIQGIYGEIIMHCRNTKEEDRFDNKSLLGRQDTGPVCRIEAERMDVTLVVGKQIQGEYTRRGDDFLSMDNACDPARIEEVRKQRCDYILGAIDRVKFRHL